MDQPNMRLNELRNLLIKNGFEYVIKKEDGNVAVVNVWIGKKDT
mgnify:CR=1 FL=1|jgi:hypothetical protein|tara:strand:+ start:286 stop:417 length:132 start_codon:yes stop_codon:yes gene_type:complete